ncbi:MAG: Hpt domain-containing protein [Salinibacterium sp.]|nr:Hpt domain-containing protein [Salinibacterium sp.]
MGDDTKTAALAAFASQGTADVIALEIAIHDNDVRAVKFACHRLRGSSLSIGATVLAAACGQLELNAAGGRRSAELLANVRRQFDAVIVEIATELSSTREASETVT